jgi:hypothetical protein
VVDVVVVDVDVLVVLIMQTVIAQAGWPVSAGMRIIFNKPISVASKLNSAAYLPDPGLVSIVLVVNGPADIGEDLAVPEVCIKNVLLENTLCTSNIITSPTTKQFLPLS